MIKDFCYHAHSLYQKEFLEYLSSKKLAGLRGFEQKKCIYSSDLCKLWMVESCEGSHRPSWNSFIVVPSLFNSPEILFLGQEQSYACYLQTMGNVYFIEWIETSKQANLADYANEIVQILNSKTFDSYKYKHLIGHCIGGNIALFAALQSHALHSLTLLTTPWDYSHLQSSFALSQHLQIHKAVSHLAQVPPIYTQILFFMLFSKRYPDKIRKYFTLSSIEKEKYLRIEKWLLSGIAIPNSLYEEITTTLIVKNALLNKSFYINDQQVDLANLNIPVCLVAAIEDQIVPVSSISALQKDLKKATLITVRGGHIAYLVNHDQEFKAEYTKWFNCKEIKQ